jgi:hypothetical protein
MGEMYVFERPHLSFWFGCGIRATPLGSNFDGEEATRREHEVFGPVAENNLAGRRSS